MFEEEPAGSSLTEMVLLSGTTAGRGPTWSSCFWETGYWAGSAWGQGTSVANTLLSCTQQWKSRWGLVAAVICMATSLSAFCFSSMEVWGQWFISYFLHPAVPRIILEEKQCYRLFDSNFQLFWTRKIHRCGKAPIDSNSTVNSNQCHLNVTYTVRAVICFHVYGFPFEIILLLFSIDFVFPSCIILITLQLSHLKKR